MSDHSQYTEAVAELAAALASVADSAARIAQAVTCIEWVGKVMLAARAEGYREGLAEHDAHLAAVRAQEARAGFQAIPGGKPARKGTTSCSGGAS